MQPVGSLSRQVGPPPLTGRAKHACSAFCQPTSAVIKGPHALHFLHSMQSSGLQMNVTIDRDTASRMGISPQLIDDMLYDAFGQRQVSIIFTQLNLYRVILEVKPGYQQNPDALKELYLAFSTGAPDAREPSFASHRGSEETSRALSVTGRPTRR